MTAPRRRRRSPALAGVRGGSVVAMALLLLAALLAPEQPRTQAEICQRHNGLAACRVW